MQYDFKTMTADEMLNAWINAGSESQKKTIKRKIEEEMARRDKLQEQEQALSLIHISEPTRPY